MVFPERPGVPMTPGAVDRSHPSTVARPSRSDRSLRELLFGDGRAPTPLETSPSAPLTPADNREAPRTKTQKIAAQWVADLTDPDHEQSTEFYVDNNNCRCAIGWLDDPRDTHGKNFSAMRIKHGGKFLREVESKNQNGVPLPEIAKYIEREIG